MILRRDFIKLMGLGIVIPTLPLDVLSAAKIQPDWNPLGDFRVVLDDRIEKDVVYLLNTNNIKYIAHNPKQQVIADQLTELSKQLTLAGWE